MNMKRTNTDMKKEITAEQIVADVRKWHETLDEQIEAVRFWRDVNCRGNFKAQFLCATAIDILKGHYGSKPTKKARKPDTAPGVKTTRCTPEQILSRIEAIIERCAQQQREGFDEIEELILEWRCS